MQIDVGLLGTFAGLLASVFSAVGTYAVLNWRVRALEERTKMNDGKLELRDTQFNQMLVTLGRLEEKIDHLNDRPWWKG